MSTFLELVKSLRQECGIAGTGPTTVTGQVGELKQLVDWTADAYTEIQGRHGGKWRWLHREFTLPTVASTSAYAYTSATDVVASAAVDRFTAWSVADREDPPKIYLTASGVSAERWLIHADWSWFRSIYKIGTAVEGAPVHVSIDTQDKLVFGPVPDAVYTVTGYYWRGPQTLDSDADEPEMPSQFHKLIVYKAMEKYAGFNSAPEVMIRAKNEGTPLMRQLEANQLLRGFRRARPLA